MIPLRRPPHYTRKATRPQNTPYPLWWGVKEPPAEAVPPPEFAEMERAAVMMQIEAMKQAEEYIPKNRHEHKKPASENAGFNFMRVEFHPVMPIVEIWHSDAPREFLYLAEAEDIKQTYAPYPEATVYFFPANGFRSRMILQRPGIHLPPHGWLPKGMPEPPAPEPPVLQKDMLQNERRDLHAQIAYLEELRVTLRGVCDDNEETLNKIKQAASKVYSLAGARAV